jgi:hypothetical protein
MKIETKELDNGNIIINAAYAELMRHNGLVTARNLWEMNSDPVKNILEERGTGRFFLEPPIGTNFVEAYIKRYTSISFRERLKLFFSLKFTKYDAFHEWKAINAFHEKDLATVEPLAAAKLGKNTCNLTLGITDYKRASELFEHFMPKDRPSRLKLIENIADFAGRMHAAGFAHHGPPATCVPGPPARRPRARRGRGPRARAGPGTRPPPSGPSRCCPAPGGRRRAAPARAPAG